MTEAGYYWAIVVAVGGTGTGTFDSAGGSGWAVCRCSSPRCPASRGGGRCFMPDISANDVVSGEFLSRTFTTSSSVRGIHPHAMC